MNGISKQGRPPVVVIGMHRSGSSMLVRCMEKLGFFAGLSQDQNAESEYFQILNRWIFWQVNATWDNPFCFRFVSDFLRSVTVRALELRVASPDRQNYLGYEKASRIRDLRKLDFPWGWKDPRNTFTVEFWQQVFPGLRVIHIYRNPVDVAASLRERALARRTAIEARIAAQGLESLLAANVQFETSSRVVNLAEGVDLWEAYAEKAISVCAALGANALSVQYEDLLDRPAELLAEIANFAGLSAGVERLQEVASTINAGRRYAFTEDPELVGLYQRVCRRPVVEQLGYGAIRVPSAQ
jgi:hypothetical protein